MSTHVPDPGMMVRYTHQRQEEDARRAARWRLARDLPRSQRDAHRQPVRETIVQGPSVRVSKVFKVFKFFKLWRRSLPLP